MPDGTDDGERKARTYWHDLWLTPREESLAQAAAIAPFRAATLAV
jgi:hypothetical protein